jgi:hypothetical protein
MKNKLLLSSALLGSLVIGSFAQAQTTVTGGLIIAHKTQSDMATQAASTRSMGRESQINIQNKGKLNNGMDYAAGFALEFDGGQGTDASNENVYIDIISGNTTFTVGVDHIQNTNRTRGVLVGNDAQDLHNGSQYGASAFLQAAGSDPAQSMGAGIVQKTPVGSFSVLYVPTAGNAGRNDLVTANGADAQAAAQQIQAVGKSAYEIGFVGDLGVKGLSSHAFYNKRQQLSVDRANGTAGDTKGLNIGASYQTGAVTVGYNRKEVENASTLRAGAEQEQDEFGLAYQLTPNLSVGLNHTKVDSNIAAAVDAKSTSIALGYNLGPVAASIQYAKGEDITNTTNTDMDVMYLRLSTAF